MVIAIDIRPLLEKEKTGVSLYTLELVNRLIQDQSHQFILFYNSWQAEIPDTWQQPNVVVKRYHWPNIIFNLSEAMLGEPYLDEMIPEADYFLFPNLNFFHLKQKPYGVVVHDLSFELFPKFFSQKSRSWHQLIQIRSILKEARNIFAVSENTKHDLVALYQLTADNIQVVYPGVDMFVHSLKKDNTEPYFLFLGRLEERKNILGLILSFLEYKAQRSTLNFSLILAGPFAKNSAYGKKIMARAKGHGDIRIVGYTSVDEKRTLLANAAVFVYPSFYEGFGFPPLEAQALGVPVIASNNSSLSEVIGSSGLLIDPYNQEDLTRAMSEMASNVSLRNLYIKEGCNNVKRFNWNNTIDQIKKFIIPNS